MYGSSHFHSDQHKLPCVVLSQLNSEETRRRRRYFVSQIVRELRTKKKRQNFLLSCFGRRYGKRLKGWQQNKTEIPFPSHSHLIQAVVLLN